MAKLPLGLQRDLIFKRIGLRRADVLVWPGIAEDSAVMIVEGKRYVVSHTDPITEAKHHIGKLAVQVSSNDVATKGARPYWSLVTLLAPPELGADGIREILDEVDEESRRLGIAVVGGHTEFTTSVRRPVVSITQIGAMDGEPLLVTNIRPGDDLVMVNYAGMEGTAVIAFDYEDAARRALGERVREAQEMIERLSIVEDAVRAYELGAVAMHDATEGGVVAAAVELSMASRVRATVDLTKVPVAEVTRDLCRNLGLSPYRLLSSGSFLVASRGISTERIIGEFKGRASVIGRFTEPGEGIIVYDGRSWEELKEIPQDEIEKLTGP